MTGSAVVPVTLVERMQSELSFEMVITAYGLSEAVVVTMCREGDDPATIAHTSGAPTAEFEVRIVGDDGAVLPAGESGEIQLRGPNVMLGYLDDPEATRKAIEPDGWFHTGDIGHLDERGYLTITDRLKDMLTVGGFNVYPAEVENAILGLDGVVECAVVGAPDERLGEVGRAYIVGKPGHSAGAGSGDRRLPRAPRQLQGPPRRRDRRRPPPQRRRQGPEDRAPRPRRRRLAIPYVCPTLPDMTAIRRRRASI